MYWKESMNATACQPTAASIYMEYLHPTLFFSLILNIFSLILIPLSHFGLSRIMHKIMVICLWSWSFRHFSMDIRDLFKKSLFYHWETFWTSLYFMKIKVRYLSYRYLPVDCIEPLIFLKNFKALKYNKICIREKYWKLCKGKI